LDSQPVIADTGWLSIICQRTLDWIFGCTRARRPAPRLRAEAVSSQRRHEGESPDAKNNKSAGNRPATVSGTAPQSNAPELKPKISRC